MDASRCMHNTSDAQGKMKMVGSNKVQLQSSPHIPCLAWHSRGRKSPVPEPNLLLSTMSASTEYISASVNRYNHAAACSSSSLIAYGSGKLVALWDAAVCIFSRPRAQGLDCELTSGGK